MSADRPTLRLVHVRRRDDRRVDAVVDVELPEGWQATAFSVHTDDGIAHPVGVGRHVIALALPRGAQRRLFLVAADARVADWCVVPTRPERTADASGARPRRSRRVARWLAPLGVALGTILFLATGWYLLIAWWGRNLAQEALAAGRTKTAVAVYVDDVGEDGRGRRRIGFLYGRRAGSAPETFDKHIPVDVSAVDPGGRLYLWYQATKVLEDDWHDVPLGFNPRIAAVLPFGVASTAANRLLGTTWAIEGGSSLSDQTCGRLRAGTPAAAGKSAVRIKIEDIACGIGLRHVFFDRPEEIGALYATHAPFSRQQAGGVELFARLFWGFDGIADPRFTRGHQLVLAAMARDRWDSTDARWDADVGEDIVQRAHVALDALVGRGVIAPADRERVSAEIHAARPRTWDEVRALGAADLSPSDPYDAALTFAVRELTRRFGEGWRHDLQAITLTVDPEVQRALHRGCRDTLRALGPATEDRRPDLAVCSALIVDEAGRVIGAHVGDVNGASELDLLTGLPRPPGSVGKLFLASQVAALRGVGPGQDPRLAPFEEDLRRSRASIVDRARALGVAPEAIRDLIACYGAPRPDADGDPLRHAALGDWQTHAAAFLPYLAAASTGEALPPLRIVGAVELRGGRALPEEPLPTPLPSRCTDLAWADGHAPAWLSVPVQPGGTLDHLAGLVDGGKTGTVPPARDGRSLPTGTNSTYVATSARVGGVWYGGLFGVGVPSDPGLDLGDGASGGATAARFARPALEALRR